MTSSLIRGRPRRSASHIRVQVAHTVLGGVISVAWLVLPGMTFGGGDPVPEARAGRVADAAVPGRTGTSPDDLVLPLVAVGAAGVLAGYAYLRHTRRARTRTTPGTGSPRPPAPTPAESDRQARTALVAADDAVRTSREELAWAEARFGTPAVEPFARALRAAETELSAAFAIRRRYEEGLPGAADARRQALVGVIGRCAEAGRRLDTEAAAFDRLRAPVRDLGGALDIAERRSRELAGRTAGAEATAAGLGERYGPTAAEPVRGHAEQAEDRLLFATAALDQARRAADSDDAEQAVRRLRAAEGAVAQADVFVTGVERLARELAEAAALVPAALTGAEAELARARAGLPRAPAVEPGPAGRRDTAAAPGGRPEAPPRGRTAANRVPAGEFRARLAHADTVLAAVRGELTGGPYDPLDALRRIARAVEPVGAGRSGAVPLAGFLAARSTTAAAEDFVTTHRAAVGAEARTLLAEAVRLLAQGGTRTADELARTARQFAERDVRTHGTPYTGEAGYAAGLAGAVLGGVLLGTAPDGGPPASFGGPRTRGRRGPAPPG
ncbi:hypothetical protein [Streptomyces shenzhenensis]|uniref:TPM domain-containing protein n=1 Tax=Streptomyces shenzhenensis TaxID=943815 RepID=A0A3M0IFM5_9ACTN|nr:hypothetical protein [Streptomyces shenzhenensis]RMB87604.1 hypothetical protein CTZ28_01170 [Streptomyces shenzhenensis]